MTESKKTLATQQTEAFQEIFDFFNDNLFGGELPEVVLNFSRSGAKTIAFFKPNTWTPENGKKDEKKHEMSLCPRFLHRPKKETFSTIVHEQCHLWQNEFGKPSRSGYHNREWADKMIELGLEPVASGGGMTGQSVSHKIMEGGKFESVFKVIEKELKLPFLVLDENVKGVSKQTRSKFTCPKCSLSAWGKPDLKLICGFCNAQYIIQPS